MTCRDLLLEQQLLGLFWQFQKTQRIGDRRPSFRHCLGDFRLREVASLHHSTVTVRLLDGIQVRTLDILHQSQLELLIIIRFLDADRNA